MPFEMDALICRCIVHSRWELQPQIWMILIIAIDLHFYPNEEKIDFSTGYLSNCAQRYQITLIKLFEARKILKIFRLLSLFSM